MSEEASSPKRKREGEVEMTVHVVMVSEKSGDDVFTRVVGVFKDNETALKVAHDEWAAERKKALWTYASDGVKHNLILDRKMSVSAFSLRKTWNVVTSIMNMN